MLNDQQKRAAESLRGLVVVDAAAGSGKTRALTHRFVNAVDPDAGIAGWMPVPVESVVAITFTEKAAGELAERIRGVLRARPGLAAAARKVDVARISTIHGFCSRLIRENALVAGLDPEFSVADTVTAGEISEEVFEQAARHAIDNDGAARQMFADYGYGAVHQAVRDICRDLVKRGRTAGALRLEPLAEPRELWGEAIEVASSSEAALAACGDSGKTVASRREECQAALEALAGVDPDALPEECLGDAIWRALGLLSGSARTTKASGTVLANLAAERVRLRRSALALALHPVAKALHALVEDYNARFTQAKTERSLLDFDDLQLAAMRLLSEHPEVAGACREAFGIVMVDEFQDTDSLQLGLVRSFSGQNLCTVGDERQSIYRFRGAEVEVFRAHRDEAIRQGAVPIEFTLNYRSHAEVLDFVNAVFGSSVFFGEDLLHLEHGRSEPGLPVVSEGEPRVEILVVDRPSRSAEESRAVEAAEVAERFACLRDEHGVNARDMAVLVRTWRHVETFAAALRARGFAVIVGGGDLLGRPEIRLVRSLLRTIANPRDEESLAVVLASPLGGLSAGALSTLAGWRRGCGQSLWDSLRATECLPPPDSAAAHRVRTAISDARRKVGSRPLSEVILACIEQLGYDLVLLSQGLEGEQRLVNVLKLARLADEAEVIERTSVAGFVAHLDAKERLGDRESAASLADDGSPGVRITTIHSAKGLEFPVVAVVGLADGTASNTSFVRTGWDGETLRIALKRPSRRSPKDDVSHTQLFDVLDAEEKTAEDEEEQRLAYVAATRAREYLLLSGGDALGSLAEHSSTLSSILGCLGLAEMVEEAGLDEVVRIPRARRATAESGGHRVRDERSASETDAVPVRLRAVSAHALEARSAAPRAAALELGESDIVARAIAPPDVFNLCPVDDLSFSALKAYLTCPRRFWAERVARLGTLDLGNPGLAAPAGEAKAEGEPTGAVAFGSAVHAALAAALASGTPSLERLDAFGDYYRLNSAERAALPGAVEAVLNAGVVVEARRMGPRAEVPFMLALQGAGVAFRLHGSIDLYARDGLRALVVDYKTGSQSDPERTRASYDLQARCYALAAFADGACEVEAAFVHPQTDGCDAKVIRLGPYASEDRAQIEADLLAIASRIQAGDFSPRPAAEPCWSCPVPSGLCPERHRAYPQHHT